MSDQQTLNDKQKAELLRKVADDVERGKCNTGILRAVLKPLTSNKKTQK